MALDLNGRLASREAKVAVLLVLAILPVLTLYTISHLSGPQWDLSVRILQGRSFLNFFAHGASPQTAFGGEAYPGANNMMYYFEPYREPLPIPILAFLEVFFRRPALAYMILMYLLYLYAIYRLSRTLKASRLVMFAVLINSYTVYFLFVPNGGEGLSVALALLGVSYLLEKRAESGILFGLAGLAKYPSICLFPLVLLIEDRRKMAYTLLAEVAITLVWGVVIDYSLYGIPFYSYLESIGAAGVASGGGSISLSALATSLGYPMIFLALGAALLLALKHKARLRFDYKAKVLLGFVALSALCYMAILAHNDPFDQARYGYLASVSLLVVAGVILGRASETKRTVRIMAEAVNLGLLVRYLIVLFSIVVLFYALWLTYASNNNPGALYYNYNNNDSIYRAAASQLGSEGFGGCRFISNAWVPMIYSGYPAYSPFVLYAGNGTVEVVQQTLSRFGPAIENLALGMARNQMQLMNSSYRAQEARYPIIAFRYTGVPESLIINLNSSRPAYLGRNFSVYLPPNATCYAP